MSRFYYRYWKEEGSKIGIDFYFETDIDEFPARQIEIWDNDYYKYILL